MTEEERSIWETQIEKIDKEIYREIELLKKKKEADEEGLTCFAIFIYVLIILLLIKII